MNYRSLLLCSLLGLTSAASLFLATPQKAQAYIARQEIRVERLKDEPYDSFIRRSELVCRAAIQRAFDRDVVMSTMVLFIIGQHQGLEAPIMSVEISRSQWQARPDVRAWATYYRMAQKLLGFGYVDRPNLPQAPGQVPIVNPSSNNSSKAKPGDSIPLNPKSTIRLPQRLNPRSTPSPSTTPSKLPTPNNFPETPDTLPPASPVS